MFCSFLWFVKITKIDCHGNENGKDMDDYGHDFPPKAKFLKEHFRNVEMLVHATTVSQTYMLSIYLNHTHKVTIFTQKKLFIPFLILNLAKQDSI